MSTIYVRNDGRHTLLFERLETLLLLVSSALADPIASNRVPFDKIIDRNSKQRTNKVYYGRVEPNHLANQ